IEFRFGNEVAYAHNLASDFYVQRGYSIMSAASTTATITAGVNYVAPTGPAFIRLVNTRLTGMGVTSGGNNQNVDDWTTYISNPENLGTSITFTRIGSTNNNRIAWEIVEYKGPEWGANGFKVRNVSYVTFGSASLTADTGTIADVFDDSQIVVFITGQANPDTGRTNANTGMHTAEWLNATDTARFTRGEAGSDATRVSYAVVEFTGLNWKIQRAEHQYTAAGAWETETIGTVNELSRTFLHTQHRTGSGMNGLDEQGEEAYLLDTSTLRFMLQSGAGTTNQYTVAWVIENTQDYGTEMAVQHIGGSRGTGGYEEDVWGESITAISSTNTTSIMGENGRSAGGGTAFPRGSITLYLNSTDTVELRQSDTGQAQNYRFSVVEWPTAVDQAPAIFLQFPPDNYLDRSKGYVNLTFEALVRDDYGMINCSFWHNLSGTFSENQTQVVTGTYNTTAFNLTELGDVTFIWNVGCYDNASNHSFSSANWTVIINWTNNPPERPTPTINTTDGTNFSSQNLNCFSDILDVNGDDLNVTVNWYKNGVVSYVGSYNDSYSNGTGFNAVLSVGNMTTGENWTCGMVLFDGFDYSEQGNSTQQVTILNGAPLLSNQGYTSEDDDGWGEVWNFTIDLTDTDPGNVNVSVYSSPDNSTWTLIRSVNVTCPCVNTHVNFTRDTGWSSSEIGTMYLLYKADDYFTGEVNTTSINVSVLQDNVSIVIFGGSGISVNRSAAGTASFRVNITDIDRDVPVEIYTMGRAWATKDGSYFGTQSDNLTSGNIFGQDFVIDSSYQVGMQYWIEGTFNDPDFKDTNMTSPGNFTVMGTMDIKLETPVSYTSDKYQAITNITFRWNITSDTLENVTGVSNILELNNQNGTEEWFEACNSSNTNDEGNGWYNCTWTLPLLNQDGNYSVRVNASRQYYYNATESYSDRFEVLTNPPTLTDETSSYEQDGGWGEQWNFTVNVTDPNIGTVGVSLYRSTDNSTWTLVNSTNVSCPCSNVAINFTRDPAWNETYIGTAYFQFRAEDYAGGYGNASANVTVKRDDVSVIILAGSGNTLDRNGTAVEMLQVNITDSDLNTAVDSATNCSLWVTTDGSGFGTRMDNTTQGSVCSYGFDPDNNYQVGVQNWTGGVYNDSDYKNGNLTYLGNLTLKGVMDIELETPVSDTSDKYQAITNITFRWNITGDALENVAGVSNILELNNQNGTYDWFEACNSTDVNDEGNGWYNCTWTLPYSKEEGIYEVRVNVSRQYYYNASENFSSRFEVLTNPPILTDESSSSEQNGGWGEQWNFTVNLSDSNTGEVEISLYQSTDNSTWTLVNSTNVSCPCSNVPINFTRDPAWNETYIGTAYFQFRADDYSGEYDNISANVTVERDDVSIIILAGSGITLDRNGTAVEMLQVNITDTDLDVVVDTATNCSLWVTTDGSNFGTRMDNTTQGSICSYGFDPDNNYLVGVQNWTGGVYNDSDYKNSNLTYFGNLTLKGTMDIELETPVSDTSDKYDATQNITFRWNITGDALENVAGASNILELNNQNGTYEWFEVCNSTNINDEGTGWYNCTWTLGVEKAIGNYEIRVNASRQYYYNRSENFSSRFEVITDPPMLIQEDYNYEQDGGWGEEWNFTVNLSDSNTGDVGVSLYLSNDNSTWALVNTTNVTCPCSNRTVNFTRGPAWSETYIGTSYFQFRANDYRDSYGNASANVTVVNDDVDVMIVGGSGISISRNGAATGTLQVNITDADRDVTMASGTNCAFWVTTDGSVFAGNLSNTTEGSVCSYDFNPDNNYNVGVQNWTAGAYSNPYYKDSNLTYLGNLTIVGSMDIGLETPVSYTSDKYDATQNITFRWNITGDALENVAGASNILELNNQNGTYDWFEVCNSTNINEEGNGWYNCTWTLSVDKAIGNYEIRVNASRQYYYNASENFSSRFEVITDPPVFESETFTVKFHCSPHP
ncbi:hypothetical protein ACFLYT_00940, partial [Nanoarchaeota archaeon]